MMSGCHMDATAVNSSTFTVTYIFPFHHHDVCCFNGSIVARNRHRFPIQPCNGPQSRDCKNTKAQRCFMCFVLFLWEKTIKSISCSDKDSGFVVMFFFLVGSCCSERSCYFTWRSQTFMEDRETKGVEVSNKIYWIRKNEREKVSRAREVRNKRSHVEQMPAVYKKNAWNLQIHLSLWWLIKIALNQDSEFSPFFWWLLRCLMASTKDSQIWCTEILFLICECTVTPQQHQQQWRGHKISQQQNL